MSSATRFHRCETVSAAARSRAGRYEKMWLSVGTDTRSVASRDRRTVRACVCVGVSAWERVGVRASARTGVEQPLNGLVVRYVPRRFPETVLGAAAGAAEQQLSHNRHVPHRRRVEQRRLAILITTTCVSARARVWVRVHGQARECAHRTPCAHKLTSFREFGWAPASSGASAAARWPAYLARCSAVSFVDPRACQAVPPAPACV